VFADDLVELLALEALLLCIPGDYIALRVEHVEGIISDGVDQKSEAVIGTDPSAR